MSQVPGAVGLGASGSIGAGSNGPVTPSLEVDVTLPTEQHPAALIRCRCKSRTPRDGSASAGGPGRCVGHSGLLHAGAAGLLLFERRGRLQHKRCGWCDDGMAGSAMIIQVGVSWAPRRSAIRSTRD